MAPLPGVLVDPGGTTQNVTIISLPSGATPTVYSDRNGQNTVSMPASISSRTTFYLPAEGGYTVNGQSIFVEGTQVATVSLASSGSGASVGVVNAVSQFGVDPTNGGSVADSSAAFATAIAAASGSGYDLFLPMASAGTPGVYAVKNPLVLGNGSSTAMSTVQPCRLIGAGRPGFYPIANIGPFPKGAARIVWTGAAGAASMVKIAGPLAGWGLENLYLDGGSTPANAPGSGLEVLAAQYGEVKRLVSDGFACGIYEHTVPNGSLPAGTVANSMHNRFSQIGLRVIDVARGPNGSPYTNPIGWLLYGNGSDNTSNTCYEDIQGVTFVWPNTNPTNNVFGLIFADCDNVTVSDWHFPQAGSSAGNARHVAWDFSRSSGGAWPADCNLDRVDFGVAGSMTGHLLEIGTPSGATVNRVTRIANTNGTPTNPSLGFVSWGYAQSTP